MAAADDYAEIRKRMSPEVFLVSANGTGTGGSAGLFTPLNEMFFETNIREAFWTVLDYILTHDIRSQAAFHPAYKMLAEYHGYSFERKMLGSREYVYVYDLYQPKNADGTLICIKKYSYHPPVLTKEMTKRDGE